MERRQAKATIVRYRQMFSLLVFKKSYLVRKSYPMRKSYLMRKSYQGELFVPRAKSHSWSGARQKQNHWNHCNIQATVTHAGTLSNTLAESKITATIVQTTVPYAGIQKKL